MANDTTPAPRVRDPLGAAPRLRDDLVILPETAGETTSYTIEDRLRGKFYRVGAAEFAVIALLDGRRSIGDAVGVAARQLGQRALGAHDALALCRWMIECHLVETECADAATLGESADKLAARRLLGRINPLLIKLPLVNPDRFLTVALGWLVGLLSPGFLLIWLATCGYALWLTVHDWQRLSAATAVIFDRDNWLALGLAWAGLKVLHEFAHGLACKKYGGSVPEAGVSLLFFTPLAYVDVSSSWRFRSKWARITTAAAGMYFELFVAALCIILWSNTHAGALRPVALNVAVMAGVSTVLFNANPLMRFDGYFILCDLLALPNLYPLGQQCLMRWTERYALGREPAAPHWPARRTALIGTYAILALAWRIVFLLALALAFVGVWGHFGVVVATIVLAAGWLAPLVRTIARLVKDRGGRPVNRRRLVVVDTLTAAALILAGWWLALPATVRAPAAFEYAPLSVVRAATPGFVDHVYVRDGQVVSAGDVLLRLRNPDLEAELTDLELSLAQSVLKARMYYQDDQLAKWQAELANQEAIEKKLREKRARVAGLTVRAPAAGHVLAHDLNTLPGRWLDTGDELAVIGREDAKELIIAVPQADVSLFAFHAGGTVDVRPRSSRREVLEAHVERVNPRGGVELPHPALGANAAGPLPVKAKAQRREDGQPPDAYELLDPAFVVRAELSALDSCRVRAGQLATVSFCASDQSIAGRALGAAQGWVARLTNTRAGERGASAP